MNLVASCIFEHNYRIENLIIDIIALQSCKWHFNYWFWLLCKKWILWRILTI